MIRDTVIVTSRESMQTNIEQLAKLFSDEAKKGINTYIKSIENTKHLDKSGSTIIRITVEFSDEMPPIS